MIEEYGADQGRFEGHTHGMMSAPLTLESAMNQFDEYGWLKRLGYCVGLLVLAIICRGIVVALFRGGT